MLSNLVAQRRCFEERVGLTFEEGMKLAGFEPAGVTASGYAQLQMGLRLTQVEYILGGSGEEISYVSSGGHSSAMYRWTRGRNMIVVAFSDDELSARSQSGL
jgi:hypothetical protein